MYAPLLIYLSLGCPGTLLMKAWILLSPSIQRCLQKIQPPGQNCLSGPMTAGF